MSSMPTALRRALRRHSRAPGFAATVTLTIALGVGLAPATGVVVRAVLRAMRVTLLNLFRKPVTVHYPDIKRTYPERYRGLLALYTSKAPGGYP